MHWPFLVTPSVHRTGRGWVGPVGDPWTAVGVGWFDVVISKGVIEMTFDIFNYHFAMHPLAPIVQ